MSEAATEPTREELFPYAKRLIESEDETVYDELYARFGPSFHPGTAFFEADLAFNCRNCHTWFWLDEGDWVANAICDGCWHKCDEDFRNANITRKATP